MTDLTEALQIVAEYAQSHGASAAGVGSWCRNERDALVRERQDDRRVGTRLASFLGQHVDSGVAEELGAYARRLCSTTQTPDPTPENPPTVDPAPETLGSELLRSRNLEAVGE